MATSDPRFNYTSAALRHLERRVARLEAMLQENDRSDTRAQTGCAETKEKTESWTGSNQDRK